MKRTSFIFRGRRSDRNKGLVREGDRFPFLHKILSLAVLSSFLQKKRHWRLYQNLYVAQTERVQAAGWDENLRVMVYQDFFWLAARNPVTVSVVG